MKNKKLIWLTCTFMIFVILQAILLMIFNFTKVQYTLEYDSASIYRHTIEMWNSKTFLIRDWIYPSSLEIDSSAFFAVFIFGLTKNIIFAFGLANNLIMLGIIGTVLLIFRKLDTLPICKYAALILILTPYSIGGLDYTNMLFVAAGQYGFRVLTILLMFNAMLIKKLNWKTIIQIGLYIFSIFWTSLSTGEYSFITIAGPCLMFCFIMIVWENNLSYIKELPVKVASIGTVFSVLGIFLCKRLDVSLRGDRIKLISLSEMHDNLINAMMGIVKLFNGLPLEQDTKVLSKEGIIYVARFLIPFIVIVTIIYLLVKFFKRDRMNPVCLLALSSFSVNFIVLILTRSSYVSAVFEERYHLIGVIPVLLALGILFEQIIKSKQRLLGYFFAAGIVMCLLLINYDGFKTLYQSENEYDKLEEISEIVNEKKVGTVFALGIDWTIWTRARILNVSDYKNNYVNVTFDENEKVIYYSDFNQYKQIGTGSAYTDTHIIMANQERFDLLPESFKSLYIECGRYEDTVLYYSDVNLLNFETGPVYLEN